MDITALLVLAIGTFLIPPIIEALGPVDNNRARRQIAAILASVVAAATTILEQNGLNIADQEALATFILSGLASKAGTQAFHDGYWTDKDIPVIRRDKTGV